MYGNEVVKEFRFFEKVKNRHEILKNSSIKEIDLLTRYARFCVYEDENKNMIMPENVLVEFYVESLRRAIVFENFGNNFGCISASQLDLYVLAYYAEDLVNIGVHFVIDKEDIVPVYRKGNYLRSIDLNDLYMVLMEYAYEDKLNINMLKRRYNEFLDNVVNKSVYGNYIY